MRVDMHRLQAGGATSTAMSLYTEVLPTLHQAVRVGYQQIFLVYVLKFKGNLKTS